METTNKIPLYRESLTVSVPRDYTGFHKLEFYVIPESEALSGMSGIMSLRIKGGVKAMSSVTVGLRAWLRIIGPVVPFRECSLFLALLREEVCAACSVDASSLPGSSFTVCKSNAIYKAPDLKAITDYDTLHRMACTLGSVARLGVSAKFLAHMAKFMEACPNFTDVERYKSAGFARPFDGLDEYLEQSAKALGIDADCISGALAKHRLYSFIEEAYYVDADEGMNEHSDMSAEEREAASALTLLNGADGSLPAKDVLPATIVRAYRSQAGKPCVAEVVSAAQDLLPHVLYLLYVVDHMGECTADIAVCAVQAERLVPEMTLAY